MSTPKRHHDIAQMLSWNFVDENGLFHCYRKQDDKSRGQDDTTSAASVPGAFTGGGDVGQTPSRQERYRRPGLLVALNKPPCRRWVAN